jgi:hypothetical protein
MTPEEQELVNDLCKRIAEEKDVVVFQQLASFCRETQNTTLNQTFGGFSHYFFLDKYVWLMAHMHS